MSMERVPLFYKKEKICIYLSSFVHKKERQGKLEINEIGHLQGIGGNRMEEGRNGNDKTDQGNDCPQYVLLISFDS